MSEISRADCEVLGKFPNAHENSWTSILTGNDRAAYIRVHRALSRIAEQVVAPYAETMEAATTSGFYEASGVRNTRPKDLWCAIVNKDSETFIRMPQIYMIASGTGIELGFAAAIHRSQFSNQTVKEKLRQAIPTLFSLLPDSQSAIVTAIAEELNDDSAWRYLERTRWEPGSQEFRAFTDLINDLHSAEGQRRGSGAVAKHIPRELLDDPNLSLGSLLAESARLFRPLMTCMQTQYKFGQDQLEMTERLKQSGTNQTATQAATFNPQDESDARRKLLTEIVRRQGQGPFRIELLNAYGGQCAVTGAVALETLEAAHIMPYRGPQTNHVTNGILLRADIHTLFDLGLLRISDSYEISVDAIIKDPMYRQFHGRQLRIPTDTALQPSVQALQAHRTANPVRRQRQ